MLEIFWVAEQLLASQEEPGFMYLLFSQLIS
jgi:hypothetical protein